MVGAYPRPRGGAHLTLDGTDLTEGLSPPARGSPVMPDPAPCRVGPIPARAGEPVCVLAPRPQITAYPRPRGGASCGSSFADVFVVVTVPRY